MLSATPVAHPRTAWTLPWAVASFVPFGELSVHELLNFVVNVLDTFMNVCYTLGMTPQTAVRTRTRTRVRIYELQAILARRGINQTQLARMLDTSRPSVNRMVNGVHDPGSEMRKRLMAVLGLGFDDLFELVQEQSKR